MFFDSQDTERKTRVQRVFLLRNVDRTFPKLTVATTFGWMPYVAMWFGRTSMSEGPRLRRWFAEMGMETGQRGPASGTSGDLHERIRRRAEEIYVQSGRAPGRDMENWSQAEREILAESHSSRRRQAVVIRVNGVKYVGEYEPETSGGYVPGEFGLGSSVTVRMVGDRMYIKRANGRELETRIVRKVGDPSR